VARRRARGSHHTGEGGGVTARFIAAPGAAQGDASPADLAPIASKSAGILITDPTAPVRVRVRADGVNPTRLRLKLWGAADDEPPSWLIDTSLIGDSAFRHDDFGLALNTAEDGTGDGLLTHFDHVVVYDAADINPDAPLP
jgi:hypothetical protein